MDSGHAVCIHWSSGNCSLSTEGWRVLVLEGSIVAFRKTLNAVVETSVRREERFIRQLTLGLFQVCRSCQ